MPDSITLPPLPTNTAPTDTAARTAQAIGAAQNTIRLALRASLMLIYSLVWGTMGTKKADDGTVVPDPSQRRNRFGVDPVAVVAALNTWAPTAATTSAACFQAFNLLVLAVKQFDPASTVSSAGEDMSAPPVGWTVALVADGTGAATYTAPAAPAPAA